MALGTKGSAGYTIMGIAHIGKITCQCTFKHIHVTVDKNLEVMFFMVKGLVVYNAINGYSTQGRAPVLLQTYIFFVLQ